MMFTQKTKTALRNTGLAVALAVAVGVSFAATEDQDETPAEFAILSSNQIADTSSLHTASVAKNLALGNDALTSEQRVLLSGFALVSAVWDDNPAVDMKSLAELGLRLWQQAPENQTVQIGYCLSLGVSTFKSLTPANRAVVTAKALNFMRALPVKNSSPSVRYTGESMNIVGA